MVPSALTLPGNRRACPPLRAVRDRVQGAVLWPCARYFGPQWPAVSCAPDRPLPPASRSRRWRARWRRGKVDCAPVRASEPEVTPNPRCRTATCQAVASSEFAFALRDSHRSRLLSGTRVRGRKTSTTRACAGSRSHETPPATRAPHARPQGSCLAISASRCARFASSRSISAVNASTAASLSAFT